MGRVILLEREGWGGLGMGKEEGGEGGEREEMGVKGGKGRKGERGERGWALRIGDG